MAFHGTYKPTYSWRMLGGPTLYLSQGTVFESRVHEQRYPLIVNYWTILQREIHKKRISMGTFPFYKQLLPSGNLT